MLCQYRRGLIGRAIFHHTTAQSTTGVSPFQLMFGRDIKPNTFPPTNAFNSGSYSAYLLVGKSSPDLVATNALLLCSNRRTTMTRTVLLGPFQLGNQLNTVQQSPAQPQRYTEEVPP